MPQNMAIFYLHVYMCIHRHACVRAGFLLIPCGSLELNSDCSVSRKHLYLVSHLRETPFDFQTVKLEDFPSHLIALPC